MKYVLVGLLMAVSLSVSAKECDESKLNAVEWRECIASGGLKELNEAYDKLIKALANNQDAVNAMKQAQDDWVKFKNSTCYFVSTVETREDAAVCTSDFNAARVKILKKYLKDANANTK